jgi:hypothetical protein
MRLKYAAMAALTLSAALGAFSPSARANTVEITFLGVTPNGSNWDYRYSATLTVDSYLVTGNTVTFFDFEGFVAGSFASSLPITGGESYTAGVASDAPTGDAFTADLALDDVQFTYNGTSPYITGPLNTSIGDPLLGFFTLTSTLATGAIDTVLTTDRSAGTDLIIGTNPITGLNDDRNNITARETTVAREGGFLIPTPLPIPVWGGMALMGLLGARRLKAAKIA